MHTTWLPVTSDALNVTFKTTLTLNKVTRNSTSCDDCDLQISWRLVILAAILLGSIFTNSLVFAIFRRKPTLLTISNRFVLNLSTCNVLLTVWVIPMSLTQLLTGDWPLRQAGCVVSSVVTMFLLTASTFSVLLISLDRYVAIVRPLHYPTVMTSRAANISLAAVWASSLLLALPPAFNIGHVTYDGASFTCNVLWTARNVADRIYVVFACTACFVLPFLVMLIIYVCVFCTAVRNNSRLRRNSLPHPIHALHTVLPSGLVALASLPNVSGTNGRLDDVRRLSSSLSLLNSGTSNQSSRRRSVASVRGLLTQYRDDFHAAKTALLVMSTFALCWLPVFVLIIRVQSLITSEPRDTSQAPYWLDGVDSGGVAPPWSRFSVIWLTQMSSVINPLVYVFHSRPLLSQCRHMLTCVHSPVARRASKASSQSQCPPLKSSASAPPLHYDCEFIAFTLPPISSLKAICEVDDRPSLPSLHETASLPLRHQKVTIPEHLHDFHFHPQSSSSIDSLDTLSPVRGVTFHIGSDGDSDDSVTQPLE